MNRFIRFTIIVGIAIFSQLFASAQIQTGYVRTVGRPDNKAGERLSGVEIKISGIHGSVVSEDNGAFDFNLQGGKESYQFTSVFLDNYELNEKEVIGRTFGVTKVPQEVVMVSLAEKNKIRREVEKQVEARYKDKYDELQAKLDSKQIEAEEYRKQLQNLESIYEKREQLVADMVERYSHTDYATLGDKEVEINTFIEHGELEKADSVINTLNISKLEADRASLNEEISKTERHLTKTLQAKAHNDSTLVFAYKGKVDIFKANFQNDSAAFYYQKIIEIDSVNVQKLLEAGKFLDNYLAIYDKALSLYEKSLQLVMNELGSENEDVAQILNLQGATYYHMGNNQMALTCQEQALQIQSKLSKLQLPLTADIYNDLAVIHSVKNDFTKSLDYNENALKIRLLSYGEDNASVALSYSNLAYTYSLLGNYNKALEYYNKALQIRLNVMKEYCPDVANNYSDLSIAYANIGDLENAKKYSEKSLTIREAIFGNNHPDIATCYNNIGSIYYYSGEIAQALNCFEKALGIQQIVYGDIDYRVATSICNIGFIYMKQNQLDQSLKYFEKALSVFLQIYGEQHQTVATAYNNLGAVYSRIGNHEKGLAYYEKALKLRLSLYDKIHPEIASSYDNIGTEYSFMGNAEKAIEYCEKALNSRISIFGENHPDVALSYNNIGTLLAKQEKFSQALEYYEKSLTIRRNLFGENHPDVKKSYMNISGIYSKLGDDTKAAEYKAKAEAKTE